MITTACSVTYCNGACRGFNKNKEKWEKIVLSHLGDCPSFTPIHIFSNFLTTVKMPHK
jgi:hypothetical protein